MDLHVVAIKCSFLMLPDYFFSSFEFVASILVANGSTRQYLQTNQKDSPVTPSWHIHACGVSLMSMEENQVTGYYPRRAEQGVEGKELSSRTLICSFVQEGQ